LSLLRRQEKPRAVIEASGAFQTLERDVARALKVSNSRAKECVTEKCCNIAVFRINVSLLVKVIAYKEK
jgi:hypothetical protein